MSTAMWQRPLDFTGRPTPRSSGSGAGSAARVPRELVVRTETIVDLYVTDARLRLREARPLNGDPPRLRLTRKGDVDARTHLVTSIYLPDEEFGCWPACCQAIVSSNAGIA